MAGISKLFCAKLHCTCYELGHTWTPSCWGAFFHIANKTFKRSVEIYAPLYIVKGRSPLIPLGVFIFYLTFGLISKLTALIRKRDAGYFTKKMILEILQSSLFLSTNGTLYLGFFCVARNLLGAFYYWSCFLLSGIPASYIAISIERKSRRGILALYVSNLAVEAIYNMLKSRGLVKPISNGEVLIFAASLAGYMYFYKMKDGLDSTSQSALKFIFGPSELVQSEDGEPEPAVRSRFSLSPDMQQYIDRMKSSVKHRLCKHQFGCIHYILNGFLRNFWMGYGIQTALTFIGTIPAMFKNPRYIYRYFYKSLISSDSLGLGVFLGLLSSLFRAVCCVLRWFRNKDDKIHGLIAGFISGLSMVYYKSSSIALYVAFKLLELVYFKGVDAGTVPYFKHGDSILYTISTAINLHLAVFEPHNLRPSYWNFLVKLTNFRFKEMNRRIIDQFVYQSSKLYPNYWPKYDPRYLTTIPLNPV